MITSLYAKLALALTVVLLLVGTLFGGFTWYLSRQHADLVVQTFNKDLASNLIEERKLIENGELSEEMLKETFDEYMAINPSIEIYLLNQKGVIVSHSAPNDKVVRSSVSLDPIRAFLGRQEYEPVLGDDPRSSKRGKAFSVAPINTNSGMFGYLYVVLRGEAYDDVARTLEQQYLVQLGLQVLGLSLVFGLLAGLPILWLVTQRLRKLTLKMDRFQRQDGAYITSITNNQGDEVNRLSIAFESMSNRILEQIHSLEENDKKRRDLVANISHDLRTPIAAILGYLERLKSRVGKAGESERLDYIETALRNASRLSTMIEELFELAKLEAEDAAPKIEAFSISDLVQDVVQQQKLVCVNRTINIDIEAPGELPLVKGDIGMIQRVLENLIKNAVTHLENSGQVVVRLFKGAETVSINVWDSGERIPCSEISRLFDRYYQRGERDERILGAGLGLYIAKQMLALHKTAIHVKNLDPIGKAFVFELPVA